MNKLIIGLLVFTALPYSFANAEGLLSYKPPRTGAPVTLSGGGTRGGLIIPKVQVLAPRQMALTSKAQPVLYWYLPEKQSVELVLVKAGVDSPLLQKTFSSEKTGLQSLRLADVNISLDKDTDYLWSVTVDNNALESVANSIIRYQLPATLLSGVEQHAENGYWYDALQQLIENHSPQANELLKQINILIPAL